MKTIENKQKLCRQPRIRKGDKVVVITGNYRGQTGEVMTIDQSKVTVRGVNVRKRHRKKTSQQQPGQIITMEMPIHVSNIKLLSENDKAVKLKVRYNDEGQKELYYKDGDSQVVHRTI